MTRVLAAVAALGFGCCAAIGAVVVRTAAQPIDVAGSRLLGRGTAAAAAFTDLGRSYGVVPIAALAAAALAARGASPVPVLALFFSQTLAQGAVTALKLVVKRPRPERWLRTRERDLSYPSGHAATAVVFFGGLALVAAAEPRALGAARWPAVWALGACVVGIPWSRLALGAHFATDVGGGVAFGTGWLAATVALWLGFARPR